MIIMTGKRIGTEDITLLYKYNIPESLARYVKKTARREAEDQREPTRKRTVFI